MKYLAANNSKVWRLRAQGYPLGWCMSPAGFRRPVKAGHDPMPFALDNGLFHPQNEPPRPQSAIEDFYAMLTKCRAGNWMPIFAVAPDVPYDGDRSIELSRKHARHMHQDWPGLPIALAVQDGMDRCVLDGPWSAVFVGGSTAWKWSTMAEWVSEAHARGMWAHVARVNTKHQIRRCIDAGADSSDGTGMFRGDKTQIRGILESLVEGHLFLDRSNPC